MPTLAPPDLRIRSISPRLRSSFGADIAGLKARGRALIVSLGAVVGLLVGHPGNQRGTALLAGANHETHQARATAARLVFVDRHLARSVPAQPQQHGPLYRRYSAVRYGLWAELLDAERHGREPRRRPGRFGAGNFVNLYTYLFRRSVRCPFLCGALIRAFGVNAMLIALLVAVFANVVFSPRDAHEGVFSPSDFFLETPLLKRGPLIRPRSGRSCSMQNAGVVSDVVTTVRGLMFQSRNAGCNSRSFALFARSRVPPNAYRRSKVLPS